MDADATLHIAVGYGARVGGDDDIRSAYSAAHTHIILNTTPMEIQGFISAKILISPASS